MKNNLVLLLIIAAIAGGCKKDNREPPGSLLSGRVVIEGNKEAVGVASNRVQLELWQRGYALYQKIPVYIAQDGTFSARLFDGNYKLVRLSGAPWANNSDTIDVNLNGNSTVEVQVRPYFKAGGETLTFSAADTSITASFTVTRLDPARNADRVSLHLGLTGIVDAVTNQIPFSGPGVSVDRAPLGDYLTAPSVIKVYLNPARYPNVTGSTRDELRRQLNLVLQKGYLFGRVGVRTTGVSERFYSQVKQINIR
jgi:hypothetical protein